MQGLLAGVAGVAERTVVEGYEALRESLMRRCPPEERPRLDGALARLEHDPRDDRARQWVTDEVRRSGVADDPALRRLASGLVDLLADPVDRRSRRVENTVRAAGGRAIGAVLERHVGAVLALRSAQRLDDPELLSPEAGSRRPVPRPVADEVGRLHAEVRRIITEVASRIETLGDEPGADREGAVPLSLANRERATRLDAADRQVRVSYQALRSTIEYFASVNRSVAERITRAGSAQQEITLLLGNAVMIYEVTNFVIDYLDRFTIDGEAELHRIREETMRRLDGLQADRKRLGQRVTDPDVEPAVRDRILEDLHDGDEVDAAVRSEWDSYLAEVGEMRSLAGQAARKRKTLEVIRDHARLHIGTMQEVAMLNFLRSNAEAVHQTVLTLESFQLPRLSPSRIRRLIAE
ncbi:hypothetical protein [Pseudonocardia pini]|uniref:hypothetical protein n=1 Tax=Pseudonocardia pini TaxID=2758030 RepID=UPI0015F07C36|nr:hypothetical protein [Pseudonocardia pini]